ncbi:Crossover junction endonuclease EME1 [Merluccius polli]|uniref:Crossover junction endonuclease EME1 n=1 Tax=Merluccius polli TaxID=89951 RepID=A0AA47NQ09_MERPO|nr:Crossover junction endonuclease EME1 [Merluccius polli]
MTQPLKDAAAAHRAATWEISESEDECDSETKTESVVVIVESQSSDDKTSLTPASTNEPSQDHGLSPRVPKSKTTSPNRKRRSRDEIEADERKAKQKREAREEQRAAKAREKEERKREQLKRKELAEHMKSLRPENCLKSLTIGIDPAVLQHDGSDILLDSLSASGWRFVIDSQQLPQTICWSRELIQPGEDGRDFVKEEQVSWVLDVADFIDVVISVKEILQGNEDPSGQSLFALLLEFLNRNANHVVTMLVIGSQINSATAWNAPNLQAEIGMEDLDMEEVMVYLQVYRNISLSFLRDWQDVTDHLVAVTKALSKRPSRHLTERAILPFCVDGSWASGSRVEKDGSGLRQVWKRQVQQLNRVSVAVATAVTTAYPSPNLLLQAYGSLESEELRRNLLAHLPVTVEGKERRVGPDISSRIYRCLSENNPEMGLD